VEVGRDGYGWRRHGEGLVEEEVGVIFYRATLGTSPVQNKKAFLFSN
jgi:hypothetical protein